MEPLPDPCNDRVMKDLEPPPSRPLAEEILFPERDLPGKKKSDLPKTKSGKLPDWRALRAHFNKEGRISKDSCRTILSDALHLLSKRD